MPISEPPLYSDKMTIPSSPDTKMEPTDSTETVAEDLDMNLDSFKISPLSASNTRPSDVDSETQSAEYRRQQQLSTKHSPKEQGVDEQEYDREHQQQEQPPQERGQPEPRLESLSRLALALAQEEEDAKQGSNHDRYVDQRDGDNGRLGDPSEYNDSYQQSQHRQRGSPSPAAHIHSYSDRETATGTHDGHSSPFQARPYSASSYVSSSQQPPLSHAHHHTFSRHSQPQQRQLPPLSPAQQPLPHLPSSSPSPTSAHPFSSSHLKYPPPPSSSSNQVPPYPYPRHAYGEMGAHRRHSVSDEGSDPEVMERAPPMSSPYQHHHHHHQQGSPQWHRASASYHFHPRSSSPQRSSYRSPPTAYSTSFSSNTGSVGAVSFSSSSDPYRSSFDHAPSGAYKTQQPTPMPVSPPTHPRQAYGFNHYEGGPLPALAPRPSQAYADDRSPRSGPRLGSPNRSPRSSLDSRSSNSMKHASKEAMTSEGSATPAVHHASAGSMAGGVVIQSARGTPKGPLPIEVQIKLLRSVLQHDPFNCAIRKTTHAWESISREQGIRARTCARRFDNIIQAYIAGRDKPVGTEEQQRTKKELLEKLFEMMNQPQALKRMQKKRRYRSEESDRRLLVETIRLNPFAQKVGQVAKAWEDIRDALNMKVHARQCIRRVNRMVKPYLLRERMYRGNIPEEMREANDDLIKQVIQLMKQAGGSQLDDYISNASSHEDSASGMSESEEEDLDDQEGPRVKRRAASIEEEELMCASVGGRPGEDDDEDMKDQPSESERNRHARHSRQSSLPPSSQQGSPRMGGHRSSRSSASRRGRSRTATLTGHSQQVPPQSSGDSRSNRSEEYRHGSQFSTPSISTSQGPPSINQSSTVVTPTTPSFPPSGYDDSHDYRFSSKYSGAAHQTLPSPIHPSHSSPSYPPTSSSSSHYYYASGVGSPTKSSDPSYPRWPPNPAHFIDVDGSGYKRPTKHARADSHGSRFQLNEGGMNPAPPRSQQQSQPQQQPSSSSPSSSNFAMPKPVFKNEQGQDMRYASSVPQHLQHQRPATMLKSPVMDRYDSSAERQSRPIHLGHSPSSGSSPTSASSASTSMPLTVPSPAMSLRAMDLDQSAPAPPHGYHHPPQAHPQQQQQQPQQQQPPQQPQQKQQQPYGHHPFKPNYPPPPSLHCRTNSHAAPSPALVSPRADEDEATAPTAQQYHDVLDELNSIKCTLKQLDQQRRQDMEVQQRMAQMIEDLQRQLHASQGP